MNKKLVDLYREWRRVTEIMINEGCEGSLDCKDESTRKSFSFCAGLPEVVSEKVMVKLEKEYFTIRLV